MDPDVAAGAVKFDDIVDVAYLDGRGRLPSDIGAELLDVLGDVGRVVVCDLTGMAPAGVAAVADAFTPASYYLRTWPGTAVVVHVPDVAVREVLDQALADERILVSGSLVAGQAQALARLPPLQSVSMLLPAWPRSAPFARHVVRERLAAWDMAELGDAAALITTELVANAVVHAQTLLHLTVVRAGDQVRVAVRDRGGGRAASDPDLPFESSLNGRGLALVESYARGWGVLPARRVGKTVWAVLHSPSHRSEVPTQERRRTADVE